MGLLKSSGTKYAFVLTPGAVATRSEATLALHFRAKAGAAVQIAFMQGENGGRYSHEMASVTYLGEHPHDARGGPTHERALRWQPKSGQVPAGDYIERLNGRQQRDGWHARFARGRGRPVASLVGAPIRLCGFALDHADSGTAAGAAAALAADRADIVRGREPKWRQVQPGLVQLGRRRQAVR